MNEHGERLMRIETLVESLRDDYLVDIREQVGKINDRVSSLEKRSASHGVWISVLWLALGSLFLSLVIPKLLAR